MTIPNHSFDTLTDNEARYRFCNTACNTS